MTSDSKANERYRSRRVDREAVIRALRDAIADPPKFVVRRLGGEFVALFNRCVVSDVAGLCERLDAYSRSLDRLLVPRTDRTDGLDYTTTWIGSCKVVSVSLDDQGVFVGLDPASPVVPVVEVLGRLLDDAGTN
jgi:hypothetical protein